MAIDLSTLEWGYRNYAGTNPSNQKATYSLNFNSGGQAYTFIPTSVVNKGVDAGDDNYVLPWFLSQDNMGKLGKNSQYVDLAGQSWYGDYLKDTIGASTTGFLVPSGTLPFDSKISTTKQPVKGIAQTEDGPAYILEPPAGKSAQYIKDNGNITTITPGRSILGDIFGGIGDDIAGAFNDTLGSINELGPWANAAIAIASPPTAAVIASANAGQAAAQGDWEKAALNAGKAAILSNAGDGLLGSPADPNAVGGVTGPDNIDVGGGFNPAAGATAAELEAARLALEAPSATGLETLPSSVNAAEQAFGPSGAEVTADQITNEISSGASPVPTPELTAQEVTDMIAKEQATSMTAAETQAMIDAEAAEAAATGATPAQVAAAKAAGMTVTDYLRAGLLVNAITGDPLGLGGDKGQQGATSGSTGFAQVPIPAEWKSPTYAAPSAPIDLSTIFSNENMLGGTQWQNLQNQQPNISFNDIFAAGQQQTPMGMPVDINQIVSSILGQAATSQKPA